MHTLALTTGGELLAWGNNNRGQLGIGNTTSSDTPVPVSLPPGTTVTAIAAGESHSLARTTGGHLLAWGDGSAGQLGDGSTMDSEVPAPVALPPGTRARAVVGGCFHTLALTTKGKVLAWGDNGQGELGNGHSGNTMDTPVRVQLPRRTKVTSVSAGCGFSLARTTKGHVLAWGDGRSGQLGNGRVVSRDIPVRVKLPKSQTAIAIGSGEQAQIALAIVRRAKP